MSFITSYSSTFQGDKNIPNISKVTENTDFWVEEIQEDILTKGLGYTLKTAVEANYSSGTPDKWKELVEGATFKVDDKTIKFPGIKAMLEYFTFEAIIRNPARKNTGNGSVEDEHENSKSVSPNEILIDAWNKAVDIYGIDIGLIGGDNAILRGRRFQERVLCERNSLEEWKFKGTMSNFIYYKNKIDATTYPDWIFTELAQKSVKINQYGI